MLTTKTYASRDRPVGALGDSCRRCSAMVVIECFAATAERSNQKISLFRVLHFLGVHHLKHQENFLSVGTERTTERGALLHCSFNEDYFDIHIAYTIYCLHDKNQSKVHQIEKMMYK